MMPLDVTHKAMTTAVRTDAIRATGTHAASPLPKCWNSANVSMRKSTEVMAARFTTLHRGLDDPARDVYRQALQRRDRDHQYADAGMTVIDWWQVSGRPHNAFVVGSIDADGFLRCYREAVETA